MKFFIYWMKTSLFVAIFVIVICALLAGMSALISLYPKIAIYVIGILLFLFFTFLVTVNSFKEEK